MKHQDMNSPTSTSQVQARTGLMAQPKTINATFGDLADEDFCLLRLKPGSGQESCSVSSNDMSRTLTSNYEAISYRWSDPDEERANFLICNGELISLGTNLYQALLQFRLPDKERDLWMDSVCIDQHNPTRKAVQLRQMSKIYGNASRVLVWLGTSTATSDHAMEMFPILIQKLLTLDDEYGQRQRSATTADDQLPDLETVQHMTDDTSASLVNSRTKEALLALFSSAWFTRLWTLQEAALARRGLVCYGSNAFDLDLLARFQRGYENDQYGHWANVFQAIIESPLDLDPANPARPLNQHLATVAQLRKTLSEPLGKNNLARILNLLRRLDCKDSRDRIMAVLHFIPQEYIGGLVEVYQSGSTSRLYTKLAELGLHGSGHPDLLFTAGAHQQRRSYVPLTDPELTLPTWVSDWEYEPPTTGFWIQNNDSISKGDQPLYKAAGASLPSLEVIGTDQENPTLRLNALPFDSIQICAPPFQFPIAKQSMKQAETSIQLEYTKSTGQSLQYQANACIELVHTSRAAKQRYSEQRRTKCHQALVAGLVTKGQNTDVHSGTLARASDELIDFIFEAFSLLMRMLQPFDPASSTSASDFSDAFSRGQALKVRTLSKGYTTEYPAGYAISPMSLACKDRRFFVGAGGYIGLVPRIAREGDEICLVPGYCCPFVIRRVDDADMAREGNTRYHLIGECYVQGVMDGELATQMNDNTIAIDIV